VKRELRKQIKQDEFLTGMEKLWRLLSTHRDEVRITVVTLVVVGGLAGGLAFFKARKSQEGREAFSEALTIFDTPLAGEAPRPQAEQGPTFPSASDKFKKAAAAFDGVVRRYPSEAIARRARYYAALSRIELGEDAAAQGELEALAKEPGDLTPALARMALADLMRKKGRYDQAAEAYRQLASDANFSLPRDYPLWNLATTLEDAGRPEEAAAAYRRLRDEFPSSAWAQEAARMASYLTGKREEG
jgi:TolA-binding protein